jgi:hypothetical protein
MVSSRSGNSPFPTLSHRFAQDPSAKWIKSETFGRASVWQSMAHKDRYEAERLLPVFQAVGLAADVAGSTEFTECDAGQLYVR